VIHWDAVSGIGQSPVRESYNRQPSLPNSLISEIVPISTVKNQLTDSSIQKISPFHRFSSFRDKIYRNKWLKQQG
jgi:hypothetical protein